MNCLHFTKIHSIWDPLIVAGGNCSITGFDINSTESFWTVTGDNVWALESVDIDFDGIPELVVGSDDFSIWMFRHEELIFDIKESAPVNFISWIDRAFFGFGLGNSSLGVYSGSAKKWKLKCDNIITALKGVNHNIDGDLQLIAGYQNGLIEVRKHQTGEITHQLYLDSPISSIMYYDYWLEGNP